MDMAQRYSGMTITSSTARTVNHLFISDHLNVYMSLTSNNCACEERLGIS
jgi:hypothetical protein